MKKADTTIRYLLIIAGAMFSSIPCFADGVAYRGKDLSSMHPIAQNEQRAVIFYNQGYEKMLIAISLDMKDEDNALWIFPVPGKPDNVKVDVLNSFPRFSGKDPLVKAQKVLTGIKMFSLMTQIYPFFTCLPLSMARVRSASKEMSEISIHEFIERWGIHAETITAKSPTALSDYLKAKKVNLDANELKSFEHYLGSNYVIVVVWIDSKEQLLKQFPQYRTGESSDSGRWPCLFVEFPTERAFYPLIATSIYNETNIGIDVFAIGYVTTDANNLMTGKFRQRYFKQLSMPRGMPAQIADDLPSLDVRYTRLRFRGSAKELTDDLWLKPTSPPGMWFAEIIPPVADDPFAFYIFILLYTGLVSYLSAGITGLVLYQKWRDFALIGLFNVFTIIAVYFAVCWARKLLDEKILSSQKIFSIVKFLTVFSVVFVLLNYVFIWFMWGWAGLFT